MDHIYSLREQLNDVIERIRRVWGRRRMGHMTVPVLLEALLDSRIACLNFLTLKRAITACTRVFTKLVKRTIFTAAKDCTRFHEI